MKEDPTFEQRYALCGCIPMRKTPIWNIMNLISRVYTCNVIKINISYAHSGHYIQEMIYNMNGHAHVVYNIDTHTFKI